MNEPPISLPLWMFLCCVGLAVCFLIANRCSFAPWWYWTHGYSRWEDCDGDEDLVQVRRCVYCDKLEVREVE